MFNSTRLYFLFVSVFTLGCISNSVGQNITIDANNKQAVISNQKIKITLDYKDKARVSLLAVNGEQVLDDDSGIYSMIKTKDAAYTSLHLSTAPVLKVSGNKATLSGITYGDDELTIKEIWKFTVTDDDLRFEIERNLSKNIVADQVALPAFTFRKINTWEGAYQGYGGLAWFYLFNKKLDTYGVHTDFSQFWNSKTGNGLEIKVDAPDREVAMTYSRTAQDALSYRIAVSPEEMIPRFDSGTHRRRYIRDRTDVWSPFEMKAGSSKQNISLTYFDFNKKFGRGQFTGINQDQVSAVLNTIARIGVIDRKHFGGNSWHTPYGPICLHEQYIAQFGLAINDSNYLNGYQDCLDYYRDNAIKPDGRVWPRWAYSNEDMMPGEVTTKGFYEAQWGYLLDANPDLVTNVVELYDQTGNKEWLKTHKASCEKALDWLLKRDDNSNGLVEMITDSHKQKRGSDWIDIIWAAYENAFVNAKLYHALILWADVERQLGDGAKEKLYAGFAAKLKANFNKPISEGGFWDEENKCYVHWRDKDGSIHGRNMVTPVNFMAIGYGICEDSNRTKTILDRIETQMQKEKLFFWPLCMYSYKEGEGNDWQFPFPNYENGDLFLSWGAMGVKAYAAYKPELAVKYIKNVLRQYAKDGLAFQRYGRVKQDGLGDDILSGNCSSVVGLYQGVYGINPMHNRFYLDPHITPELAGTKVNYQFRGQTLSIDLDMNRYAISNGQFKITAARDFGFYASANRFSFFNGSSDRAGIEVKTAAKTRLAMIVKHYDDNSVAWTQTSTGSSSTQLTCQVHGLKPNQGYAILVNKQLLQRVKTDPEGSLTFNHKTGRQEDEIVIESK